jgi:magnesium transporter
MSIDLQRLYEEIRSSFDLGDPDRAAELLLEVPASEIADLFRSLDRDERIELVRRMPAEQAAAVLSEVDDRSLAELFEFLQDREIVDLLDNLPSDDAADLVGYLEEDHADRVIEMLERVDRQDAVELKELLRYPEDSAGGVMAKEYLSIRQDQSLGTVSRALRQLDDRELGSLHYCFVVDARGRLVGRVSLLRLLLSDTRLTAQEIMEPEPIAVGVMEDQEDVANLFLAHDLLSLPVVDPDGRLVGRITVDDAMDVLSEEATEDVARLAGSSAEEVGETSPWRVSRARLPWLVLGLLGQLLAALVLSHFEGTPRDYVVLAMFIPMVMATAGNTGIQTSSIMIRMLVTQEFDKIRASRHVLRELAVGLLNGALLGGLMVVVLWLWKQDIRLGLIIGVSLMTVVLFASLVGTLVPWFCDRLRIDPTLATGPFITTSNDVMGLAAYLTIAHWLLRSA